MGTCGEATAAHSGDLLACGHVLTDGYVKGFHVAVDGDSAIVMAEADPLPVAGGWAGVDDGSIHDCVDRGANVVGDVNAVVHCAPAGAEGGGEGALRWCGDLWGAGCFVGCDALFVVVDSFGELFAEVRYRLELRD